MADVKSLRTLFRPIILTFSYIRVRHLKDQILQRVGDLSQLKATILKALKDPDERQQQHKNNLRNLFYRIEDIIETSDVHDAESQIRLEKKKVLVDIIIGQNPNARPYIDFVVDVMNTEKLLKMLYDLDIDITILRILQSAAAADTNDGQPPAPAPATDTNRDLLASSKGWPRRRYINAVNGIEYFVGRRKDLELVSSHIISREKSYQVVYLSGDTAFGKSAMAWKIYTDSNVRKCFKAFAWVTLTAQYDINIVVVDILRQLGLVDILRRVGVNDAFDLLFAAQSKSLSTVKDCLIVVDQIEEFDQWNIVFDALSVRAGPQTKILLMTCKENVASDQAVSFWHKLEALPEDDGWELLKKHAFAKKVAPGLSSCIP